MEAVEAVEAKKLYANFPEFFGENLEN